MDNDLHPAVAAAVADRAGYVPDGIDLGFEPFGDDVEVRVFGDRLEIAYVALDPWPDTRFWKDDGKRGTFRRFRAASARERHLRRLADQGSVAFDVVTDAEGTFVPRLVGAVPDPVAVYALPEDSGSLGDMQAALAEAAEILEAFSAWGRGESCGIVVDRFTVDPDTRAATLLDSEPAWLQLGPAAAGARLASCLDREHEASPGLR